MDRLFVAELVLAFFVGSAIALMAASALELRSHRRWVKSVQDGNASLSGQRQVAVYLEPGNKLIVFQMFPILIFGPILPFVLYSYLGQGYEMSTNDLLATAGLYIVLGLGAKAIVTRAIRRGSFVVSEDGIDAVKEKRGGYSAVTSIKWKEVTKVDLYDILPEGMGIDGAGKRIIVPYNMENLEPLFEIMRRRVTKDVIRKGALEFISKPERTVIYPSSTRALAPGDADNGRKLTYSLFIRCFFSLMVAICYTVILFSYLYSPRSPGVPDLIPYSILTGLSILFTLFLLELFFSYFAVNDEGIERKAFWGKRKFIPWSEVDSIIYVWGRRRSGYQVRGAGKMFELATGLVGLSSFGRMVVAKVPPDKWAKSKREILNDVEREEDN